MNDYSYRIAQLDDGFHWAVCYRGTSIVEAVEDTLGEAVKAAHMVLDLFRQSYEGEAGWEIGR